MKCLKLSEPCRFRIGSACELTFFFPRAKNPCKETTRAYEREDNKEVLLRDHPR